MILITLYKYTHLINYNATTSLNIRIEKSHITNSRKIQKDIYKQTVFTNQIQIKLTLKVQIFKNILVAHRCEIFTNSSDSTH